jgi:hypothetical protein
MQPTSPSKIDIAGTSTLIDALCGLAIATVLGKDSGGVKQLLVSATRVVASSLLARACSDPTRQTASSVCEQVRSVLLTVIGPL